MMNKRKRIMRSILSLWIILGCTIVGNITTANASINQQADPITVRGNVSDNKGESLIGVTVKVKDGTTGTVTDVNGNYILHNVPKNAFLEFSYVGMTTKQISVNSQSVINVALETSSEQLSELVVIGYGSVKKSDLTGSVASVMTNRIKDIPSNSIDRLLQGRAAGLQVINSSQDPGSGATVRIRGGSSLRGSNSPLLVVDGFPMGEAGDLKQINPSDIVSIEILKDASASAIYGSRGANGVIIITTNKVKEGITKISIQHQTIFSQFTSKLVYWNNPVLMAQLNNEQRINGGLPPLYIGKENSSGVYFPSVSEIQNGTWPHFTRWDNVVFRNTPVSNNTTVSINSANSKTSFNLSLNYFDEDGIYIEDDYQKGIARLAVDHQIFDNLTIRTSNIFSKNLRTNNSNLGYWRNPLWPVYNADGSYFLAGKNDYGHPIALVENRKNKNEGLDYISSWLFDFNLTDWLNLKSQVNYRYGNSITDIYNPKKYTEEGDFNNGAAHLNNWMGKSFSSENYATFDKTLAEKHVVNIMAGHSYEYAGSRTSSLSSYDFVNEATGNENMASGNSEKNRHYNSYTKTKLLSFMGRGNYTFDDKYLFTATMRADGSSKFGAKNKWAYFPSVAFSWKAQNEPFISNLHIFDELKFRLSYGVSGNQGISPYQTLSRYGVEQYYDEGRWKTAIGPGYVVGYEGDDYRFRVWGGIPNVNLKWETTSQANIGLDVAFLQRRLRFTVDAYIKNTYDLLRESLLPLSSGYNRMWINDGKILNKGFEFTAEADIICKRNFNLSGNLIFSMNRNKVVSLGDDIRSGLNTDYITGMKYEFIGASISAFRQSPTILAIGQPVNVFYGYKTDGIIQSIEEGQSQGLTSLLSQPGEFKYLDLSGDGRFDDKDRTIIGNPNPDFTTSMSLNGNYKNFDFDIFLNGVFGNDILYQNMWGGQANTMPLRWTQDNPNNDYPSLRDGRSYYLTNWYVKDGSFLRIQNVSLGYNFKFSELKYLDNLRLSVNISDLYTFTKFKGYDPEVGLDGIYWGGYPRLRKWTFGLNITF